MNTCRFRAALFCFLVAVIATPARAVNYTVTILNPNVGGIILSRGYGISDTTQVGYSGLGSGVDGASLWSGTAASYVNLHPAGYSNSFANAVSGTSEVGDGQVGTYPITFLPINHALLWHGTAASVVDLHPSGFDSSVALDVSGSSQVGFGDFGFNPITLQYSRHALLWNSTAASVVDLNPAGATTSDAEGISGSTQVGSAVVPAGAHAMLWHGTAASAVDLNPAGFISSIANDVSGAIEVGSGTIGTNNFHALLWTGSAASVVDLHAAGFAQSAANGVSAAGEVGYGNLSVGGNPHALLWHGTAGSVVDLQSSLSAQYPTLVNSIATGISDNGSIIGFALGGNNNYAVLWTPVAESGVAGDYNNNGIVDAGDYIAWRKGNNPLHNEVATIGSNTPEDYTEWRARYGNNTTGSGSELSGTIVPEPTSYMLIACALAVMPLTRVRPRRT